MIIPKWPYNDDGPTLWRGDTWGIWGHLQNNSRVLDFGANNGLVTALAACNGAFVSAYEPHPCGYERLLKTIEINNIQSSVVAIQSALWIHTGIVKMNLSVPQGLDFPDYFSGGITETCLNPNPMNRIGVNVSCISLADAVGDIEWDIVKMDVEGAEFSVLLSCPEFVFNQIKFLTVEVHLDANNTEEKYQEILNRLQKYYTVITQDRFSIFATQK